PVPPSRAGSAPRGRARPKSPAARPTAASRTTRPRRPAPSPLPCPSSFLLFAPWPRGARDLDRQRAARDQRATKCLEHTGAAHRQNIIDELIQRDDRAWPERAELGHGHAHAAELALPLD